MKFLESICYENGYYPLLEYHQMRLNDTLEQNFESFQPIDLNSLLPDLSLAEKHKIRVVYDHESYQIEYASYQMRELKSIKLVYSDEISYDFKYEDRSKLQALFDQRGEADEIIIIKNGLITDSFYANVALWDGNQWITPSTPLLFGTRREALIQEGKLTEMPVLAEDLKSYSKICLINAMLDLEECELDTKYIK